MHIALADGKQSQQTLFQALHRNEMGGVVQGVSALAPSHSWERISAIRRSPRSCVIITLSFLVVCGTSVERLKEF